jgi:hypothetical protein
MLSLIKAGIECSLQLLYNHIGHLLKAKGRARTFARFNPSVGRMFLGRIFGKVFPAPPLLTSVLELLDEYRLFKFSRMYVFPDESKPMRRIFTSLFEKYES